jgi:hypothetical protein
MEKHAECTSYEEEGAEKEYRRGRVKKRGRSRRRRKKSSTTE